MQMILLAGTIIMENGGETYRAEDTVSRMAKALGCSQSGVFAVPSGLFVTLCFADGTHLTQIQRISTKGIDLTRVDEVNTISRSLAACEISAEEGYELLKALKVQKKKSLWWDVVGAFVAAGAFCVMFGGGPTDSVISAIIAALVQLLLHAVFFSSSNGLFMQALIGSFLSTLLPLAFQSASGIGIVDTIVGASLMPFVPGIAMTNAVRDTMRGDFLSGVAHFAEALLKACMIVGGAVGANYVFSLLGGVL